MTSSLRTFVTLLLLCVAALPLGAADDPRGIVAEAQKRTRAESQQYEGVLQVTDPGGKVSEKAWSYLRLGSNGASKVIIRFTRPAEVKGVALLVVNFPDKPSD